jgi:aspartyl-tRNA(Asn)/glutamyl-tRNA(Gln) amidotransferase subunit C
MPLVEGGVVGGPEPMALSRKEVEHIAELAKLDLEEAETSARQLSSILEHFRALQDLDTKDIAPTAQVITLSSIMRPDEVRPCLSQDEVLANAPRREDGYFKVKAILEAS